MWFGSQTIRRLGIDRLTRGGRVWSADISPNEERLVKSRLSRVGYLGSATHPKAMTRHLLLVLPLLAAIACQSPQERPATTAFYFGNDLSYVNQMEDCGAVFKEDGVPKDPYRIFADHGHNMVRVRLWVDPTWQHALEQPDGVRNQYGDLHDVMETIERSHDAGMKVLLDIHYSDIWADPQRQAVPARWAGVFRNPEALADSVYAYTFGVMTRLEGDGLMPAWVQIGNETNPGMMIHGGINERLEGIEQLEPDWERQALLFQAGIRAVREAGARADVNPRIVIHFAGSDGAEAWYERLIELGVEDFDIIGLSQYYSWHGVTPAETGDMVRTFRAMYPHYDVAVVEAGYPWTSENFDQMGNIIGDSHPDYAPLSPEVQRRYLVDVTGEVMNAGGNAVMFWEPAWVSTPCATPWGVGSGHDHVVFFEPGTNEFMGGGGGTWPEADYAAWLAENGSR